MPAPDPRRAWAEPGPRDRGTDFDTPALVEWEEGDGWNRIEIAAVGGVSRAVACLNRAPAKFIVPKPLAGACAIFLSTYGGGLFPGDRIRLRLACGPGSRLFLGSQAYGRIYRGREGAEAEQWTEGRVDAGALAVVAPDPVQPFASSRYRQVQRWTVAAGGNLLVADWIHAGREARGERFAFHRFASELRVEYDGGLAALDRWRLEPGARPAGNPGRMAGFGAALTLFAVGEGLAGALEAAEAGLPGLGAAAGEALVAGSRCGPVTYMIRALGVTGAALLPLRGWLGRLLAGRPWLGFDPWERKW